MGLSGCDISRSSTSIGLREVSARQSVTTGSTVVSTILSGAGMLSFGTLLHDLETNANVPTTTNIIRNVFFIIVCHQKNGVQKYTFSPN